jgi:hypothetical protein
MLHELFLLTPYTYPAQSTLMVGDDDMACWLNGYSALWHPAALFGAARPPQVATPYDHEQPLAGNIYALPESPPLLLPEDWHERARAAGAIAFAATTDRAQTLANLLAALKGCHGPTPGRESLLTLPPEKIAPFFGLGFGHVLLAALSEAMEHENLLEAAAFWEDVQQALASLAGVPYEPIQVPNTQEPEPDSEQIAAIADQAVPEDAWPASASPEDHFPTEEYPVEPQVETNSESEAADTAPAVEFWYGRLQSAAQRLLCAREVLYPVAIHLLDIVLYREDAWLPANDLPVNLVISGAELEKLAATAPERIQELREKFLSDRVEVCGGTYVEREDALLPLESQLWNLLKGQAVARELLGADLRVFARKRFGFHPQLPLFLSSCGLTRAVFQCFDEGAAPTYQTCVVNWPSPDGKQVEAFVRQPHPVDSPKTFLNLGHYLFKTTREDHAATLAFVHKGTTPAVWYYDLLELSRLAPVAGTWTTLSRYLGDVMAGDYAAALSPDDFHFDYLNERTGAGMPAPVSAFAHQARMRRRLDMCWTLAALQRGLAGRNDPLHVESRLHELEDALENSDISSSGTEPAGLAEMEKTIATTLTQRLQVKAEPNRPGYMILNPSSFTRRVALELDRVSRPLPLQGPVKACQIDADKMRVVVEVPSLGFAWIDREGPPGTPAPTARLRLADKNLLRNEFFEVEVDPETGGLRAIRDHRTRVNRLGQRLVFNPGGTVRAESIETSSGPALGEVTSQGAILGDREQVLARFRQRFRVWLGRPLLEMRIEIEPEQPPAGYPWHAYFGARFAWRDERATLLRSVNGTAYITADNRPQTPDFLELRLGGQRTIILPGGLPFHQRADGRMLDIILVPEGEKEKVFELGIGLDREHPMQTALGMITPVAVVPTNHGPPHVGAAGWLFHLDAPNVALSRLIPGGLERAPGDTPAVDAVTARMLECAAHGGPAEFRCVRNPARAALVDARGQFLMEATTSTDTVFLDVAAGDLLHLQVDFSGNRTVS